MAGMVLPWNLAMKDQLYLYPTGVGKKYFPPRKIATFKFNSYSFHHQGVKAMTNFTRYVSLNSWIYTVHWEFSKFFFNLQVSKLQRFPMTPSGL